VPCLRALMESAHEVLAVVTQPDRPRGRGGRMRSTPVKSAADKLDLVVMEPERLRTPESVEAIKSTGADCLVVVAYGQKIPKSLLEWPRYGVVNVHGSLLPKYRGAAPIQRALMNGETTTGVTTMLLDEGWDTGDMLLWESTAVLPDEDAEELGARLAVMGAELLVRTLDGLEAGTVTPTSQDDSKASLAPAIDRSEGLIEWSWSAERIANFARGLAPRPGAFFCCGCIGVKLCKVVVVDCTGRYGEPGEVLRVDDDGILIAAGKGQVRVTEVHAESRKCMPAAEFACGAQIKPGVVLGNGCAIPRS